MRHLGPMSDARLNADVAATYRAALLLRLQGAVCPSCGAEFNLSSIASAQDGTSLDEYRLTDISIARVIAETQHLALACGQCGARVDLGAPVLRAPERRVPPVGALQPLSPEAALVYRARLRERLRNKACPKCERSLEFSEILRAVGGTGMDDYDLDDHAVAELLAVNQDLFVRCGECGAETRT